jgi:hypothetical protein
MATSEVQIPGTQASAKIRTPWVVPVLGIVTLGIYLIFWYYFINREMADLGRAKGTDELGHSPGTSVLAITLGALVFVPAVISIVNTGKRIQAAQRLTGIEPQMNGWLAVVMGLVIAPVLYAYEQSELNKVWRKIATPPDALSQPQPAAVAPVEPTAGRPVQ